MTDEKTDVDGDISRRLLALQLIEIANEARMLAMEYGRFADGEWRTFDIIAMRAYTYGACEDDANTSRGRAGWQRSYAPSAGSLSDYRLALAALFDRVADLHSPAEKLAA